MMLGCSGENEYFCSSKLKKEIIDTDESNI